MIVALAIILLMGTNMLLSTYTVLVIVAFSLFGLGLGFYATPSTDAAPSALPEEKAGSGSGIYKMASSLGASFGVAISATIFTAFAADGTSVQWLDGVIAYLGRQENVAVREAALLAFGVNLLMAIAAIISVMLTIPKSKAGVAADTGELPGEAAPTD